MTNKNSQHKLCEKVHHIIVTSSAVFRLWPQFSFLVCMLEAFISTRMELGWRLKPESDFNTAEKIHLHTVKLFSRKVNLGLVSLLKLYKYIFSQVIIPLLSNILAFATPLSHPY